MAALLKLPFDPAPGPEPVVNGQAPLLNRLRFHATTCRASARLDVARGCDLVAENPPLDAALMICLRVLDQALGKPAVFFKPGAASQSFDERWLLSLLVARHHNDLDSLQFLVTRRIAKPYRRQLVFLLSRIADAMESGPSAPYILTKPTELENST